MVGAGGALGGGGGLVAILATSTWYGAVPPPHPLRVVPATPDNAVFSPWLLDDESIWSDDEPPPPNCSWWNGTVVYSSDLCSHFSLSRMASNIASRATQRAVQCAAHADTDCVLSAEIGLSVPAAFVYDPSGVGMRMIIAPRVLPYAKPLTPRNPPPGPDAPSDSSAPAGPEPKAVRIQDPEQKTNGRVVEFNNSVTVEYLPGGSRAPVSETLTGSDAYCVQLLRAAFSEECWAQLD